MSFNSLPGSRSENRNRFYPRTTALPVVLSHFSAVPPPLSEILFLRSTITIQPALPWNLWHVLRCNYAAGVLVAEHLANPPTAKIGAGSNSPHVKQLAADVVVPGQLNIVTANQAEQCGMFGGIGWYQEVSPSCPRNNPIEQCYLSNPHTSPESCPALRQLWGKLRRYAVRAMKLLRMVQQDYFAECGSASLPVGLDPGLD